MSNFTLTITPQELQVIANGLADQPYKVSAPVLASIGRQVTEQEKAQAQASATPLPEVPSTPEAATTA